MNLRDKHKYYSDKTIKTEIIWFHYHGAPCDTLMQTLFYMNKMPFIFKTTAMIEDVCHCFDIMLEKALYYEFTLSAFIFQLLNKWAAPAMHNHLNSQLQGDAALLSSVQTYIEQNIQRHISLEELANHIHLSKFHFCRVFSKQFKIPPAQYILQEKINISKKYLLYTSDPIRFIAEQLGFTDQCHYSRVFKNYTGQTPSQYRRSSTNL